MYLKYFIINSALEMDFINTGLKVYQCQCSPVLLLQIGNRWMTFDMFFILINMYTKTTAGAVVDGGCSFYITVTQKNTVK